MRPPLLQETAHCSLDGYLRSDQHHWLPTRILENKADKKLRTEARLEPTVRPSSRRPVPGIRIDIVTFKVLQSIVTH